MLGRRSHRPRDGERTDALVPAPIAGIDDATLVLTGWRHACAIRDTGTVVCWGDAADGLLGDGATLYSAVALDVRFSAP